jgi:hypothetical protein
VPTRERWRRANGDLAERIRFEIELLRAVDENNLDLGGWEGASSTLSR